MCLTTVPLVYIPYRWEKRRVRNQRIAVVAVVIEAIVSSSFGDKTCFDH